MTKPSSSFPASSKKGSRSELLLVEADVVADREVTGWPSLRTDLENAVDQEVVVDGGLVTSRKPGDVPAFSRKLIEDISKGIRPGRREPARSVPQPQAAEALGPNFPAPNCQSLIRQKADGSK